jgi:YHS domain-containing protein
MVLGAAALAASVAVSVPVAPAARRASAEPPAAAPVPATGRQADQQALKAFASLVGSWRGAGQVERGRTRGAWTESADWAWKLNRDAAALAVTVPNGKYVKAGVLRPGREPNTFTFEATLADGSKRSFTGKATPATGTRQPSRLVLSAGGDVPEGSLRKLTLTPLHDTRLLVLLEAEDAANGPGGLRRLGEVGYTRQGVTFAAGESYPVCIVTGGRGTTEVRYKGKSYWVCCSGCRDLFEENPEAVLAEAAKAKAK